VFEEKQQPSAASEPQAFEERHWPGRIGERICEAARKHCRQGFAPIPIPYRQKGPVQHGWQKLRIIEQTLQLHFNSQAQNIGILLGQASAGLVDVDLDCPEAELLAAEARPDTGLKTGRMSKPKSHFFYRAGGVKTRKFTDPEDHSMLVEIRSDGCQRCSRRVSTQPAKITTSPLMANRP
jgi:hypothetical protein